MGRKKGKQSGSFGSKKIRFQAERLMHLAIGEDDSRRQRRRVRQRWPVLAPAPSISHTVNETIPSPIVEAGSTLLELCAVTIGEHFEYLTADAETLACFEALPGRAIEVISKNCSSVRESNVDLLVTNTLVERLYVRGDLEDLRSIFPRRVTASVVGDDEWTVRDVAKDFRGCVALRDLILDAPVTTEFFEELCRALPDLERLELGSRCPCVREAVDVLLSSHPNLRTLDVASCDWFFLNTPDDLLSHDAWDRDNSTTCRMRRRPPINLVVSRSSYDLLAAHDHRYYQHPLRHVTLSLNKEHSALKEDE